MVPGEKFIDKPVAISDEALPILRNSGAALRCYESSGIRPEQVLASWFIGSEIHLDGPDEVDLIVLPNLPRILTGEIPVPLTCLVGAHTGPFWVLRQRDGKYEMLFEANTESLRVLNSKTNGHRDLNDEAKLNDKAVTITSRFDGKRYQFFRRQDTPVNENH